MLGFSLSPGEFAVIGDAIVRLTQIKSRRCCVLAVQVDKSVPICRLDLFGNPINLQRRITDRRTPCVDPAVAAGTVLLKLSCGHEVAVQAGLVRASAIECPQCVVQAREFKKVIATHFVLGESYQDLQCGGRT
jgi:hypothetical protein